MTKQSGFSRSSTSTLLLLLVVGSGGILLASGSLSEDLRQVFAYIFFAVIGFAGGLFAARDTGSAKPAGAEPPASGSARGGGRRFGIWLLDPGSKFSAPGQQRYASAARVAVSRR